MGRLNLIGTSHGAQQVRQRWGLVLFASLCLVTWYATHSPLTSQVWLTFATLTATMAVLIGRRFEMARWALLLVGVTCAVAAVATLDRFDYEQWEQTFDRAERGKLVGKVVDVLPHAQGRFAIVVQVQSPKTFGLLQRSVNVRLIGTFDELIGVHRSNPADPSGHIEWPARIYPFNTGGNPGEFSTLHWAMRRGWLANAYVDQDTFEDGTTDADACLLLELVNEIRVASPYKRWLKSLSARWRCRMSQTTDPRVGTILVGLLLGQKDLIDPHLTEMFSRAGLGHLLAVSGLHVGYVLLIFTMLFRRMPSLHWIIVAIVALTFVGFVSSPASSIRAGLMAIVAALSRSVGRRMDRWHLAGIVGSALLVWQPLFVTDLGFQLSFLAVFGLAAVGWMGARAGFGTGYGIDFEMDVSAVERGMLTRSWTGLKQSLLATLGAHATTWPLIATAFMTFSWISPLTNLVGVPLAGAALGSTLIGLILWEISPLIGDPILWVGELMVSWMVALAQATGAFGAFEVSMPSPTVVWGWYALFGGWVIILRCRSHPIWPGWVKAGKRLAHVGIVLLVAHQVYGMSLDVLGVVDVWVLDVGQGDAILIKGPWKRSVLVDGGGVPGAAATDGFDVGDRIVVPTLKRLGVRRLEMVINTHPHEDHLHGLVAVINQRDVRAVYASAAQSQALAYRLFQLAAEHRGQTIQHFIPGQVIRLGPGTELHVLAAGNLSEWINPDTGQAASPNLNDRSVALLLQHAGGRLLLLGDLEIRGQRRLLGNVPSLGHTLDADVVVVPHHGAKSSYLPELWERAAPHIAVISVGTNRYGHPSPEVTEYLDDSGMIVKTTDRHGAVRLRFWPWGVGIVTVF